MSEISDMLADSVDRLFGNANDTAQDFDAALWSQVQELGLPLLLVPEERGGVGARWDDALAVLHPAGRHAIGLPVAEGMLAAHLAAGANLDIGEGLAVAAPVQNVSIQKSGGGWQFTGTVPSVPWGRHAHALVTVVPFDNRPHVIVLHDKPTQVREGRNLAFEPRDDLHFESCTAQAAPSIAPAATQLYEHCALLRLAQIVGALEGALALSIDYARERKQFGRAIGQFQAVQQQLALFGAEAAAVSCATRAAFRAAAVGDAQFQIAAAKLRANMAIGMATATAHQVHAAIGFTWEHRLRRYTQRLMSWRSEFGNDRYWAERLGAAVAARGAECFWSDLTTRDDAAALA